ncbi:hypothetical protein [Defluviimonas salinarum]|nr:hypothetical protein [Defluviimonas salinarum]
MTFVSGRSQGGVFRVIQDLLGAGPKDPFVDEENPRIVARRILDAASTVAFKVLRHGDNANGGFGYGDKLTVTSDRDLDEAQMLDCARLFGAMNGSQHLPAGADALGSARFEIDEAGVTVTEITPRVPTLAYMYQLDDVKIRFEASVDDEPALA